MSLYKEVLMEHFRNPKFKFSNESSSNRENGINPSCGDNISIFYNYTDSKVTDLSYTGNGCAISMASADIMCEIINLNSDITIIDKFINMIEGDNTIFFSDKLEKLEVFKELQAFPARRNCAILPWKTLKSSISTKEQQDT